LTIVMTLLLGLSTVYLVHPPTIVRIDDEGLAFDRTRVRWEDVSTLELQDTLFGRRLLARVVRGRSPRLLQAFVPAALDDVVAAVLARGDGDVARNTAVPTRMARFRRPVLGTVLVATLAASVFLTPVPGAATEGPDQAEAVARRMSGVQAHTGSVLILAVQDDRGPAIDDLVRAAVDDTIDVHWRLRWTDRSAQRDRLRNERRELSEVSAAAAAASCAGRPVTVEGGGVVVTDFFPLTGGTGSLARDDAVVAADGRAVRSVEDLYSAAAAHRPGEEMVIEARAASGTTHTASVPIGVYEGAPVPLGIGFKSLPVRTGPAPARVDLRGYEGGSAGLAAAMGLVDALATQPFINGRRIAVTGTIAPDGSVGPIAGLRFKAAAAQRAKATVLVVPETQADFARGYAGEVPVIGVHTLDEAVRALGGAGCQPG
jgi:PDZ domain-containing secreted protein